MIFIQTEDFDQGAEYLVLAEGPDTGAIVTFVGRVRDFCQHSEGERSQGEPDMLLEHYAGMTEKVLADIIAEAKSRWQLHQVRIVHRIGRLSPGDQIVFVGASARHRKDAFAACEFMMDFLKTRAPFWKKEGGLWLDAKDSDLDVARQWAD